MKLYEKLNIKRDLFGGLSAGIVTLPIALAYGVSSGLGPMAGMSTAIVLGFLGAILGGTRTQISCPVGAMTVAAAAIIAYEVELAGSVEAAMPFIMLTFILTGFIQFLMGVFKLGTFIRYMPHSVVSGFMSGIGIIIIILQFKDVFGVYDAEGFGITDTVLNLGYFIQNMNVVSFIIALSTVLIIYLFPLVSKKLPSSLLALILVTTACFMFDFEVAKIGEVSFHFTNIDLEFLTHITNYDLLWNSILSALSLAFLGAINTLLTSVIADKMTDTKHDSNMELVGQGVGNFCSALLGGFPGSGATACTVVNIQAGGRNKISGVICALFLAFVLFFGGSITALIPNAVLAGVLVYVGIVLIDTEALKKFKFMPTSDLVILLLVLFLTVFWKLHYAVVLGLVIAAFYFMKNMADVVETSSNKNKVDRITDLVIDTFDDAKEFKEKVFIKNLAGPIFFGFSSRFVAFISHLSANVEVVVFNMSLVPFMDHSGVRTFQEIIAVLNRKNVNVYFSEVSDRNLEMLMGYGLLPTEKQDQAIFSSVEECVMWLHEPGRLSGDEKAVNKLYIPTAFTPNGDGVNDDWAFKNIDLETILSVDIINSESHVVFSSSGYQKAWDGKYKGKLVSPGVYKYTINRSNEAPIEGVVHVFR